MQGVISQVFTSFVIEKQPPQGNGQKPLIIFIKWIIIKAGRMSIILSLEISEKNFGK